MQLDTSQTVSYCLDWTPINTFIVQAVYGRKKY